MCECEHECICCFHIFFFFSLLAIKATETAKNSKNIRHTKNEEHTPQFHIWNNLIHLYLFCHFFPLFSVVVYSFCLYAIFFVQRYYFFIASIPAQRTTLLDTLSCNLYEQNSARFVSHKKYNEAQ